MSGGPRMSSVDKFLFFFQTIAESGPAIEVFKAVPSDVLSKISEEVQKNTKGMTKEQMLCDCLCHLVATVLVENIADSRYSEFLMEKFVVPLIGFMHATGISPASGKPMAN